VTLDLQQQEKYFPLVGHDKAGDSQLNTKGELGLD
jgi:hypothetical protein